MNNFDELKFVQVKNRISCKWPLFSILILVAAAGLTACGNKDKKAGQTLARVDGQDITVLQLNGELQRANIPDGEQEAARKKILESLIDRQLITAEAMRNKIDRKPDVMAAIERAKMQIIAQAYLQGITSKIEKPSPAEVEEYFQKHPELYVHRKQFNMKALLIASSDLSDALRSVMDNAKSLDEVEAWLVKHDVKYMQGKGSRSSTDLPPEMAQKLESLPKGGLFIINETGKSMLVSLVDVKESPVSTKEATPQIEQYLLNQRTKEVVDTELAHLRSLAKIEYLNASPAAAIPGNKPASRTLTAPEPKPAGNQ